MWNYILMDGHPEYVKRNAFWVYNFHGKQSIGYELVNLVTGYFVDTRPVRFPIIKED